MTAPRLVEHFFRHEYGRVVSALARRVGVHDLQRVEDAVQSALATALEQWPRRGAPDNPSAWLFRVAFNELRTDSRNRTTRQRILERHPSGGDHHAPEAALAGEVADDLLRMLFVCCDEALPAPSQLVLALKTLCGFDVREIAQRLFTSEANVYKRLARARGRLATSEPRFEVGLPQLEARLPAVHHILYLLFTEGYLSSHAEIAIRRELCDEAIRLAELVAAHPVGQTPATAALLALMHLHLARIGSRQDEAGSLLLLDEQDRSQWDPDAIQRGLEWLSRSAQGTQFSRYHAEARIAAAHCLSPSLHDTRWDEIAEVYELLERLAPSPLHRLNHALAVAEWKGPQAGLDLLDGTVPPTWMAGSYLWSAAAADLNRRAGHVDDAQRHLRTALELAPSDAIRALLHRRFHGATTEGAR